MPDDTSAEPASASELACTACRNRKLKCDRAKPACTRCTRIKGDCTYPESRRKPAFKRRNVRELEARLGNYVPYTRICIACVLSFVAQVEDLLKKADGKEPAEEVVEEVADFDFADFAPLTEDVLFQGMDYTVPTGSGGDPMLSMPQGDSFNAAFNLGPTPGEAFGGELVGLGMSEPLPPFELMEELNRIFFERQQMFMPVLHPARYLQSFYSAPHMKPPMCLQYGIWAIASNGNEKYHHLHDVFYQRARQYAEADEMKGYGEHFITLQHAQAWCLITVDEAKSMLFTRAAMSSAKAVRLCEMLGLHRLDIPPEEISPTLLPPKDWLELEERRRTFWGTFCIDSHCAISTGWPHLIDSSEILKHVHRPKPDDNPQNYEYGDFWKRHRELDNTLSSAFMFLPEDYRLPENYQDPTAINLNLNYHASIICLHLAAFEKMDQYKLPLFAKKASESRLMTAAQEIVNIVKMASHLKSSFRSPMTAISLYCAASVYIFQSLETQSPKGIDNLDFVIAAMDAIGREHMVTRAFLKQVMLDIERNDLTHIVRLPRLDDMPHVVAVANHNIPLLVRSKVSRHSRMQPPLPGRLPLGNPSGNISHNRMRNCGIGFGHGIKDNELTSSGDDGSATKRMRPSSVESGPASNAPVETGDSPSWTQNETGSSMSTSSAANAESQQHSIQNQDQSQVPGLLWSGRTQNLPHRTDSPAVFSGTAPARTPTSHASIATGPGMSNGTAISPDAPGGEAAFEGSHTWGLANECSYRQSLDAGGTGSTLGSGPWSTGGQDENVDWAAIAAASGVNLATLAAIGNAGHGRGNAR
ncbi:hypothetical protein JX266_000837 [Neoarthrinium moseri]|nr:hypothetical protein JX266_000837 [Neoarthrinium moseri]